MTDTVRILWLVSVAWAAATAPDEHWAFRAPVRPPLPAPAEPLSGPLSGHPVDAFVQACLEREGLSPAPEADRPTLLRRLSLDLVGLPPTPEEVEAFVADPRPDAYERQVQRLLASPRFGERWASWWLDLARYADTQGYEKDSPRQIWPYRDWVAEAFARDLPFDRFTVEQLAGDLLPDPTPDQLIATAFHRNTLTNDEGGTDDEEFRVAAVVDRVNTTMEVWMGLTVACAQCHDHKYDPIGQREYYALFDFFNQSADVDLATDYPTFRGQTRRRAEYRARLEESARAIDARFDGPDPELERLQRAWEQDVRERLQPFERMAPEWSPWRVAGGPERPEWTDGRTHELSGEETAPALERSVRAREAGTLVLCLKSDRPFAASLDGVEVLSSAEAAGIDAERRAEVALRAGANLLRVDLGPGEGPARFAFRALPLDLPSGVFALLEEPPEERPAAQAHHLRRWFRANHVPALAREVARRDALLAELSEIGPVPVPILRELEPGKRRETRVLEGGSFLAPGEAVRAGVPAVLPALDPELPRDRLGLARWLVSPDNPLTARVLVNRLWEQLFGTGLVETAEDFGTRGAPPSHPELLDWLAVELVDGEWSVHHLLRTIVTSHAYRQSSRTTPELLERDPHNRLLARGPRFRLPAEALRDQALAVAGLLSERIGGPPVFPPQPAGMWRIVESDARWETSEGEDRYRRALYTFWRRTSPYPTATLFDAPSRELCISRRLRTNTPLQALATLNDPVFVEAAQALARRVAAEADGDAARIEHAFRLCLARPPGAAERERIAALLAGERAWYAERPDAALRLATDPLGPLPEGLSAADAAAWTTVANVLLNLDELLTKG